MNYKSQLRGWCVDRIIEMHKVPGPMGPLLNLHLLKEEAEALSDWAYVPDKDWEDTGQHMLEMADEIQLEKLQALIAHLAMIEEKRSAQAERLAAKVQASLSTGATQ